MFKKLLVPLDGSDQSERIGIWAYGMARGLGATVSLLAVVDPDDLELPRDAVDSWRQGGGHAEGPGQGPLDQPVDPETAREPAPRYSDTQSYGRPSAVQVIESSVERAKRYLNEEAERIQRQGGTAEVNVAVGDPEEEIVRQADDSGADLIAMATRRESALARGIVGSVTDRVARNTHLPMLVAHVEAVQRLSKQRESGLPSAIIVPLDGSELSERAVPVAEGLASALSSRLVFARAMSSPYYGTADAGMAYIPAGYGLQDIRRDTLAYLEQFVDNARAKGLEAETWVGMGPSASAIMDAADEADDSLIVMSTHGRSGIRRLVLGSVTDKVMRSSGHPVLILPQLEAEQG